MRDDDYQRVFSVKIKEDDNVSTLKDIIKEKASPDFNDIVANSLLLWKVSLPYDRNLIRNVNDSNLIEGDGSPAPNNEQILPLLPLQKISTVFSEPPLEGRVHIVVKPPQSLSTSLEANSGEKDDIITALKTSSFSPFSLFKVLS